MEHSPGEPQDMKDEPQDVKDDVQERVQDTHERAGTGAREGAGAGAAPGAREGAGAGAGPGTPEAAGAASILDIAYGILFSPKATLVQLAEQPRLGQALAWYVVVSLISTLGSAPELGRTMGGGGLAGLVVLGVAVSLVVSFVLAAIWHVLAELFGGRGRGVTMWTLLAYSSTPSMFMALGAVISSVSYGLWVLLQLALGVWVIVLDVLAVSANYKISGGRAFAVVIIPVAVLIVLAIIAMVAVVSMMPGILGQMGTP